MKLTEAEKLLHKQLAELKRTMEAKFPGCFLSEHDDLQLSMDAGDESPSFSIRTKADIFRASDIDGDDGWIEAEFYFRPDHLAEFVACLIARLEFLLSELNANVDRINCSPVTRLFSKTPPGRTEETRNEVPNPDEAKL